MRWIPTYFLTLAMAAFGTVTQGDDDAWFTSLFLFAPISAVAIIWILFRPAANRHVLWFALAHILTFCLGVIVLPAYWLRVTLGHDHIGAGFSEDYVKSFEPARWHTFWAPVMTALLIALIVAIVRSIRARQSQAQE